jgi:3-oxoacyl-[acyl-carrier protein] reductase
MSLDLTGKTALVTGGGIGIGRAIALALARAGADVALTYLTHAETPIGQIVALGRRAFAYQLDVTDSVAVNQVFAQSAADLGGHIDILVNNAGYLVGRVPLAQMSDAYWHRVVDVNLSSTFYCIRAVLPFMNRGWGRIVNMSSLAGRNGGGEGAVAYAAAKGGVLTLTHGAAKELAPAGIHVNAVAPGMILGTPFHAHFSPPAMQQATLRGLPVGHAGAPEDVAAAVLFLASDAARFITGATIDLNGGAWFA